jgi:hypothetical protein
LKLDPYSFDLNLQFGRALFTAERYEVALSTFNRAFDMAETDSQRGQIYYYRALTQEANGAAFLAVKDWQALLDLPEGSVPKEWLEAAQERLGVTPSPTPTPRRSPTPKSSPTPTKTGSAKTPTPTATQKTTATVTPTPGSNR